MRVRGLSLRFVPFLFLSSLALAQPVSLVTDDASRGLVLPPTSPALSDEATATVINPAGLSQLRSFELMYAHDRGIDRGTVADGLYLADTFGPLGLGFDVEWIRQTAGSRQLFPDRRRTTWGLSLGSELFSLGAGFGFYSSDDNAFLDRSMSFDLGVLMRPAKWLSFGAVARNLNQPVDEHFGTGLVLNRTYDVALGLRPFGDRITLGADYLFDDANLWSGRMSYVLHAVIIRGITFKGAVSHGISPVEPVAFQLGLTFDLPNFGLSYAGGYARGGTDHVVLARLSSRAYPAIVRPGGKVALLDLNSALTSGRDGALGLLGGSETDAYLELTRLLAQAERDEELATLVVKIEDLPEIGLARADELRQSLLRIRHSGKKVVAVMLTGGDAEYLVATGADCIYALPQSMLMVNGVAAQTLFLGGTMDKLGVKWNVARVGAYKNAPDELTRTDMSPEQRETINAYLDVDIQQIVSTIANARHKSEDEVRAAIKEGLLTPSRAKELGLIDGIIQPSELENQIREISPDSEYIGEYATNQLERRDWGRKRQIAIVPVVGTISSGKSREDPLGFTEVAGAETVVRALKEAETDPNVAAIVLRVDSGGGDAMASDLMYRAVLDAKKVKPVIASMGDMAASGGYMAAMGANRIYATPTTITGSIGVFFMKPAFGGLAEKLGAHEETIQRGEASTLLSPWTPWTPEEQAVAQKWVDAFYDDFITEVAASRNLQKQRVDEIARGRVWAGKTAKELGLVDEMGTLAEAIKEARRQAGVPEGEPLDVEIKGEPASLLHLPGVSLAKQGLQAAMPDPAADLSPVLKQVVKEVGVAPTVLFQPGLKAMLPFSLHVE